MASAKSMRVAELLKMRICSIDKSLTNLQGSSRTTDYVRLTLCGARVLLTQLFRAPFRLTMAVPLMMVLMGKTMMKRTICCKSASVIFPAILTDMSKLHAPSFDNPLVFRVLSNDPMTDEGQCQTIPKDGTQPMALR